MNFNAAGGLYSTPNDMLRFMQFQLDLGKLDGKQVVPPNIMRWLLKPSNVYPGMKFKRAARSSSSVVISDYSLGLGLFTGAHNSWEKISHGGYFPPYRAELSWYPALKLGIFTSTHQAPGLIGRGLPLHAFIVEAIRGNGNAENVAMDLMKQQKLKVENERKNNRKSLKYWLGQFEKLPEQNINHNLMARVIGTYGNAASGEVEIFRKYNVVNKKVELYLSHGKWVKGWMESVASSATGDVVFKVHWDSDFVQDYYVEGDKDAVGYVTISKTGGLRLMDSWSGNEELSPALFEKGLQINIDNLDPAPWKSDQCK